MTVHPAIAVGVAEDHEHLVVSGIAVIPGDSEIGAGDAEAVQRLVGAVGSADPLGE